MLTSDLVRSGLNKNQQPSVGRIPQTPISLARLRTTLITRKILTLGKVPQPGGRSAGHQLRLKTPFASARTTERSVWQLAESSAWQPAEHSVWWPAVTALARRLLRKGGSST
jgi:hypothetical protein